MTSPKEALAMTALTDEQSIHKILTELVEEAEILGGINSLDKDNKKYVLKLKTAIANATDQIRQQERVEKVKGVSIFIKSVRGMMRVLALDRSDLELIEDYGMLGIHNIRAVNESLAALADLEALK